MTWLSSEILMAGCFASGAYRSLKTLKDGETDFDILVYWCVVASIQFYASYFEWIFSWFPFYFYLKSLVLLLLMMPRLRISRIIFHTLVIPGITYVHGRLATEWPRLEALPYLVLAGTIDLLLPGVLGPIGEFPKADPFSPSSPNSSLLGDARAEGEEESQIALRERARSNRTTRDLALLNRRHRVSQNKNHWSEGQGLSHDEAHSSPSPSPKLCPMSTSPRSPGMRNSPVSTEDLAGVPPPLDLGNASLGSVGKSPLLGQQRSPPSFIGGLARKVLTGSKEVSIRDHLFDLAFPPPPTLQQQSADHHHHHHHHHHARRHQHHLHHLHSRSLSPTASRSSGGALKPSSPALTSCPGSPRSHRRRPAGSSSSGGSLRSRSALSSPTSPDDNGCQGRRSPLPAPSSAPGATTATASRSTARHRRRSHSPRTSPTGPAEAAASPARGGAGFALGTRRRSSLLPSSRGSDDRSWLRSGGEASGSGVKTSSASDSQGGGGGVEKSRGGGLSFLRSRGRGSAEELRRQHLASLRSTTRNTRSSAAKASAAEEEEEAARGEVASEAAEWRGEGKGGSGSEDDKEQDEDTRPGGGGEELGGSGTGRERSARKATAPGLRPRRAVAEILRRHEEEIRAEAKTGSGASPSKRPVRKPSRATAAAAAAGKESKF